jgi:hypothetical protein
MISSPPASGKSSAEVEKVEKVEEEKEENKPVPVSTGARKSTTTTRRRK